MLRIDGSIYQRILILHGDKFTIGTAASPFSQKNEDRIDWIWHVTP